MKKYNINAVMLMAAFLSTSTFAAAPVSDVTMMGSNSLSGQQSGTDIEVKLEQLTRLLETRNKMQARLQTQVDQLLQELNQVKGTNEVLNHKLEQVETRQRNLYQLIDELDKSATPQVATPVDTGVQTDEKVAYQKAVDLVLVNKDFEQAITAFEAFIIDYPQSSYIANSYYWLGQLLYKEKKRSEARAAFLTVAEKYPESNKRPDSLYKIGFIDEYLGNVESAKIFYTKVVNEFPDSSAAELSKKRLVAF
jgi:tol-pal system protein YbgF